MDGANIEIREECGRETREKRRWFPEVKPGGVNCLVEKCAVGCRLSVVGCRLLVGWWLVVGWLVGWLVGMGAYRRLQDLGPLIDARLGNMGENQIEAPRCAPQNWSYWVLLPIIVYKFWSKSYWAANPIYEESSLSLSPFVQLWILHTLSPIIMVQWKMGAWKMTLVFRGPFSTSLWEEGYISIHSKLDLPKGSKWLLKGVNSPSLRV